MFKEKLFDATLADKFSDIPVGITEKPGMRQAFAEMFEILKHYNHEVMACVLKDLYPSESLYDLMNLLD